MGRVVQRWVRQTPKTRRPAVCATEFLNLDGPRPNRQSKNSTCVQWNIADSELVTTLSCSQPSRASHFPFHYIRVYKTFISIAHRRRRHARLVDSHLHFIRAPMPPTTDPPPRSQVTAAQTCGNQVSILFVPYLEGGIRRRHTTNAVPPSILVAHHCELSVYSLQVLISVVSFCRPRTRPRLLFDQQARRYQQYWGWRVISSRLIKNLPRHVRSPILPRDQQATGL